ncbi:MAG TPA: hypothetical protein VFI45_21785, partial [Candidatus Acidoferrum sp.]|nr:hypothetical protein [Candidatus Acidoferrum sp.]
MVTWPGGYWKRRTDLKVGHYKRMAPGDGCRSGALESLERFVYLCGLGALFLGGLHLGVDG